MKDFGFLLGIAITNCFCSDPSWAISGFLTGRFLFIGLETREGLIDFPNDSFFKVAAPTFRPPFWSGFFVALFFVGVFLGADFMRFNGCSMGVCA
jgi:hypothetical protein